ncbi:7b219657-a59c-476c-b1ad-82d9c3063693 [Sclerotinia trifoliorum]|uniref:7b219657-a59c-476c-b1ad-82d9c3063693 n=1 Tax=Sclerotinia trifoliorum TaxID=28548 RepID=A0A8H2W3S1_9HELO|nr:7b219657-a59c-476c-b1ad-82d9c3063693 [Sclerotinia trifoliorum]
MIAKQYEDYSEEYLFPGSDVLQQPSGVDTTLPPIYSKRVLIFSTDDTLDPENDRAEAVRALRQAMQATVEQYPVLGNGVSCSSGAWKFFPGQARLLVKELPMTYKELKNANFSSTLLQGDVLTSVPEMADLENDWDCCRIQANFIKGGLLLCVSIFHLAMDGASITQFIQDLARNSRAKQPTTKKSPAALDRSRLSLSSSVPDITKMPAYLIASGTSGSAFRTAGFNSSTMYQFTNESLSRLKSDCSANLPAECQWISTQDAACALVFRQKVKARLAAGIIKPTDLVQYSFPVEFRSIIDPPLPSDFVGNAVLITSTPFMTVERLLEPDGLSLTAGAIRQAVKSVDAAFVDNAIAVMNDKPDGGFLTYYGAIHCQTTGFFSTTYKSFVMPDKWHRAIGNYELMRLLHGGLGDGLFMIMPVRQTGWEVIVTLAESAMDNFEDEEWRKYAVKIQL